MRSAILLSMEQDNRTEKYQRMHQLLNEKQWRQFLALEAKERGNLLLVAREAGVSRNTIKAGRREVASGDLFSPGKRIRGEGGGRKKQEKHDASLQADLEALLDPKGDPMISVDCKKKELIGHFKNNGREWQPKGEETTVNVYDYLSLADGKAVPYGVYDLVHNQGFVNVGVDHDTAEFAVESIRRWWQQHGQRLYPQKTRLLITADGGGSNAARSRLWKREMQRLANETGLTITVCHFPPGTSKWNKIEHRLFSYISINWRAKPLISLETVIELISHTTTQEGLVVTAIKDANTYPTGIKVSDEELKALHITRADFHGEWNYTFEPEDFASQGLVI